MVKRLRQNLIAQGRESRVSKSAITGAKSGSFTYIDVNCRRTYLCFHEDCEISEQRSMG